MLTKEDIDVAVTKFTEDIKSAVTQLSNEICAAKNPFSLPPYLKGAIRHRNRLRKRWKIDHSALAREMYINFKNYIRKEILRYREDRWNEFVEGLNTEDGTIWKVTRKLSRKYSPLSPLTFNGTTITTDEGKANLLAGTYERQFVPPETQITDFHRRTEEFTSEYIRMLNEEQDVNEALLLTKTVIKKLKNKKAP
ncbi:hypothetical protein JGG50_25470, partial [Salmonella enterica subsp. enterica serovar Typhimurium]|nr:hypothetical protein [Salmonella enterica subsp. enterica serovar Typhimurium]